MSSAVAKVRVVEGNLDAKGLRFAVVVARFNALITENLVEGAVDTLLRSGASEQDVVVFRTPGSYELAMVSDRVLATGRFDAVIALGCLIRGDTLHFELIAGEAAKGLAAVGIAHRKPVAFGVLTTDNLEQAFHRAGAKAGNKGSEAALVAIEQAQLYRSITSEAVGSVDTP